MVVFAHGFDANPGIYAGLLRTVAAAGYVVAAPLFPISGSGLSGPPREDDMANQALDLREVISAVTGLARPGRVLAGLLDPTEVAVAGHSDGAETAAASVLVTTDEDPRIKAALLVAGQLPTWGQIHPVAVPTLVVQGSADVINPPQLSQQLYERLRSPKVYLDVTGAGHMDPVTGTDQHARAAQAALVEFLDAELLHSRSAWQALRADGRRAGGVRIDA